eukprot:1817458-Lingulodinium_polyedra.AAC.1
MLRETYRGFGSELTDVTVHRERGLTLRALLRADLEAIDKGSALVMGGLYHERNRVTFKNGGQTPEQESSASGSEE